MDKLGSLFLPPAKSTNAADVDALFGFISITSVIIFVGILIATIAFIIIYKRKSDNDVTSLNDHNTTLEIVWSIIPVFLIVYVFYWGFTDYLKLNIPPANAYEVQVIGQKWNWAFKYNNGYTSPNELHVPKGRPVKLVMQSRDVLHSFYIPDFRIKHDVIPNRYTTVWFEAIESGESVIFCTEYCGTSHSDMLAKVIVHEEEDFQKWLKESGGRPADMPLADYGKMLYTKSGCQTCHSTDGSKLVGPSYKGLFGSKKTFTDGSSLVADETYIKSSILNPSEHVVAGFAPVMPTYQGILSNDDIDAIIEFIKEQK
ncbi:cytochrome c oxidase subunit II [bacterium]|nr:MAG: cytochrome c oxidase subunit II [bacterium]